MRLLFSFTKEDSPMLNQNLQTLLAQTICEKPESYTIKALFSRFQTVHELMEATEEELTAVRGIGPVKARAIASALQLSKSLTMHESSPYIIRSPQDAFELIKGELMFLTKEHFVTIFLNTKNHVIGRPETISIGSLNAAIVHPREVFKAAIRRSSASIIVAHNHPSSDVTPSPEDISLTRRLHEAGLAIGIDLLDHLVVSHSKYYSMKEAGLI